MLKLIYLTTTEMIFDQVPLQVMLNILYSSLNAGSYFRYLNVPLQPEQRICGEISSLLFFLHDHVVDGRVLGNVFLMLLRQFLYLTILKY